MHMSEGSVSMDKLRSAVLGRNEANIDALNHTDDICILFIIEMKNSEKHGDILILITEFILFFHLFIVHIINNN